MTTKLTLTIDDTLVAKAKRYAAKQNTSLSKVIENYLKLVTKKEEKTSSKREMPDDLKAIFGSVKLPKNFDYKKELEEALIEKHWKI